MPCRPLLPTTLMNDDVDRRWGPSPNGLLLFVKCAKVNPWPWVAFLKLVWRKGPTWVSLSANKLCAYPLLRSGRSAAQADADTHGRRYRKTNNCRVSRPLSNARSRALDKYNLCRVPTKEHSANIWHTAWPTFAECWPSAKSDTRHILSLPSAAIPPLGKGGSRAQHALRPCAGRWGWRTAVSFCRVSTAGTRQRPNFAECGRLALGKDCTSLSVFFRHSANFVSPSACSLALGKHFQFFLAIQFFLFPT